MKKITLLTASVFALGGVALSTGTQLVHADVASTNITLQNQIANPSPRITILDHGEFAKPITLDTYEYSLNQIPGFESGKVVLDYDSSSIGTIGIDIERHFNLKLPTEFNRISGLNSGANLKAAIKAEYKLPGDLEYTEISPEDINTSYEGQVDFKLRATKLISAGQKTSIKVQINYGQILDELDLGSSFDYKSLIPDAVAGGYTFSGTMSTNEWLSIWPSVAATGTTDGTEAVKSK